MMIQQHDGVVVDAGRHDSRASPCTTREKDVTGREGSTKSRGLKSLLSPTIYRGAKGGAPALVDGIY